VQYKWTTAEFQQFFRRFEFQTKQRYRETTVCFLSASTEMKSESRVGNFVTGVKEAGQLGQK
jgi:hypothetical protein